MLIDKRETNYKEESNSLGGMVSARALTSKVEPTKYCTYVSRDRAIHP